MRSATSAELACDPAADHIDDVVTLRGRKLGTRGDVVVLCETRAATSGRRVLRDEDRMTTIRSLSTIVVRLRRGEATRDDVVRVLAHRSRAAHESDGPVTTARAQVKLRAEALTADGVEPAIELRGFHAGCLATARRVVAQSFPCVLRTVRRVFVLDALVAAWMRMMG